MAAVTLELAQTLKCNPVPIILSEIFCANLGGSATMCGDPPNIIIGTSLGYTFGEFISNTGFIALISLIVIVIYFTYASIRNWPDRVQRIRLLLIPIRRMRLQIKVSLQRAVSFSCWQLSFW